MATKYENVMAEIAMLVAADAWMARVKQECDSADAMVRALYTNHLPDASECGIADSDIVVEA